MQPGDCVILNAANSTVGQLIIQLCHLLQLRCVAIVREREQTAGGFTQCADRLKALGATQVFADKGSLKVCSGLQSSFCSRLLAPVYTALQLCPLSMLPGGAPMCGPFWQRFHFLPFLQPCLPELLANSNSILPQIVMISCVFEDIVTSGKLCIRALRLCWQQIQLLHWLLGQVSTFSKLWIFEASSKSYVVL